MMREYIPWFELGDGSDERIAETLILLTQWYKVARRAIVTLDTPYRIEAWQRLRNESGFGIIPGIYSSPLLWNPEHNQREFDYRLGWMRIGEIVRDARSVCAGTSHFVLDHEAALCGTPVTSEAYYTNGSLIDPLLLRRGLSYLPRGPAQYWWYPSMYAGMDRRAQRSAALCALADSALPLRSIDHSHGGPWARDNSIFKEARHLLTIVNTSPAIPLLWFGEHHWPPAQLSEALELNPGPKVLLHPGYMPRPQWTDEVIAAIKALPTDKDESDESAI